MEQNTNTAIKVHESIHEQNHRTLAAILTELRSMLGLADGQSVVEAVRALVGARRAESALTDDANAFRLEADLRLDVEWGAASVTVGGCTERYSHGDDPRAAKRRAIARAAARAAGGEA